MSNPSSPKPPHDTPQTPYSVPQSPHVVPQAPHVVPQTPHVVPQSPHTVPQSPHTVPQSPHTVPQSPHVVPQTPHGIPQTLYNTPRPVYSEEYRYCPYHSDDFSKMPRPRGVIAYVSEGNGTYTTPDGTITVNTGQILFIPCGSAYISHWGKDGVTLTAVFFEHTHPTGKRYLLQSLTPLPQTAEIFSHFHELPHELAQAEAFYRILSDVWYRFVTTDSPPIDERICRARDYLEKNLYRTVTVAELAAVSFLSESHFHSCFKAAFGVSPIEYKRRLLVTKAQTLLSERPELSVSEIGTMLGFDSETYFRRVFKAVSGRSPREFRECRPTI